MITQPVLKSSFRPIKGVHFPEFQGRQHYMHEFNPREPSAPEGFEDYISLVSELCETLKVDEPVFVTFDEKVVEAGMSQRRPGPHVDGCFMPEKGWWGHGGGAWLHGCNAVPVERMPVVVAASVTGCRVWEGEFQGEPRNNGDLSHINDQLGEGSLLDANVAYLLSPDCVHESMTFEEPTQRSFLRIALPVHFKTEV